MKCHYEVLGLERDVKEPEIKTAYRKLALRWHPDKNPDNPVEAKERFQLLQQAYDVLSDPQERAWYDNHREQILRGKNSDYEENCLDLFQYFTVSCFKGYGNDKGGFYKVYAEVFETIATEDAEFMDDPEEISKIPKFGDSQSNYEEVVGPFYAYWQSYCTKKNYAWLCPYDITEVKDRRVLREIEKDLKKIVQKAKRERNEEVRNLVSFIRKRDKRVQANKKLLEERAALNRQKQEQNRLEQIRKRNREVEEMKKSEGQSMMNDAYEAQLKQLEQEYGNSETDDESDFEELAHGAEDLNLEDEMYLDDLYCIACNRAFTNENAFLNHETSKKHKENVEKLKLEMLDEENSFENGEEDEDEAVAEEEEEVIGECLAEDELDEILEENSEEEIEIKTSKKSKKNKKAKKPANQPKRVSESETEESLLPELLTEAKDDDEDDWNDDKKAGKKSKGKKGNQKKPKNLENPRPTAVKPEETPPPVATPSTDELEDINHNCVTCHSTFDSKNKLFAHLKKTNHGVYIPKSGNSAATVAAGVNRASKKGKKK